MRLVVAEVMRQLKQQHPETDRQDNKSQYKALVIFTGGTIGFEQSLSQLKKLQELKFALTIVLSAAAEKITGSTRLKAELGNDINIVTTESAYPGAFLREADLVLVPVLTQNTAAKLALTLSDTLVTTLILQALMQGKHVIAAVNAADPMDGTRLKGNMGKAAPGLMQALRGNLQKLDSYGIKLVDVECLARESEKIIDRTIKPPVVEPPAVELPTKKAVLDAATIKAAAIAGAKSVIAAPGTIVTPLARDVAREYGVEIVQENVSARNRAESKGS